MARGWESKAVEDQVQESQSKSSRSNKGQLTPTDLELNRRREVLVLSRTRVQRELESSQNPRYTDQLTRALADLDAQLASLPVSD
ncbi:MAG TPA: hypothetical protein VJW93_05865 [Candidatus Acidoferrales bacterium]|nr:hypothetical protein [Candidatus Acidoferrales bacterium]